MRPPVRRVGDRQSTRRDYNWDNEFAPTAMTHRTRRASFGEDWNVAHPRAGHLPSMSKDELVGNLGGFSVGIDTNANAMRAVASPSMYEATDDAATRFLRGHGFDQDGEPFKRARP